MNISTKFLKGTLIPALSLLVALGSVVSTVLISKFNAEKEIALKKFEVTYKLKYDAYSDFVNNLYDLTAYHRGDEKKWSRHVKKLEASYAKLEPLLEYEDRMFISGLFYSILKDDFDSYNKRHKIVIKTDPVRKAKAFKIAMKNVQLVNYVHSALFSDDKRVKEAFKSFTSAHANDFN